MNADGSVPRPGNGGAYAYSGPIRLDYAPQADGDPDPGEIVWAWVPYEEDPAVGKDRPLLVIGRGARPGHFVALMLSTRDRAGERGWVALGTGSWDHDRRESWVRTDRPLGIADGAARREGAVLNPDRFLSVLDKVRREQSGENVD